MKKVIILKIMGGDFDSGFSVGLQVWDESGGFPSVDKSGHLPPHPHLEGHYFNWQTSFRGLNSPNRGDDFDFDDNLSDRLSSDDDLEACRKFAKLLEENMKTWLLHTVDAGWQQIREKVVEELAENQGNVRIMIQAHPQLWKMPWLEWDVFDNTNYPEIGIGFSPIEYQKPKPITRSGKQGATVRILAVFGNNENIDLEPDKQAIAQLPNVELEPLDQPSAAEVIQKLRDKKGWDIFFFAGHSQTKGDEGIIYINERESLEIGQFKEALKEAIRQGLQLAIFNSCDGLGLAQKLGTLQLPIAIVMKEPVPDRVAQCFLKEFLKEYASGAYLYTAVRRSQAHLEEFLEFPGCTGLPIICQNPAEVPPTWEELRGRERPDSLEILPEKRAEINPRVRDIKQYHLFSWRRLKLPLTASLIIGMLVMGMRWQGKLERWELPAYDHLMQQRPMIQEEPDRRILVIRVTEEDRDRLNQPVEETGQGARSLSDQTLESILAKLNTMQPLVIGLNILREGPVDSNYPTLKSSLEEGLLIATCVPKRKFSSNPEIHRPISAPDDVPEKRIGFDDFVFDLFNPVIRRQLLLMTTKNSSHCRSNEIESLSLRIATFYLERHNKIRIDGKEDDFIRFDNVYFPQLKIHRGGYHRDRDVEGGIQVMLNYKPYQDYRKDFVRSVTLTDFLNNDLPPEQVQDSIVLIGRDSSDERHLTPYSKWNTPDEKIPGVFLHAQMISHIIDVVEGNRPLIWTWPWWVDGLWIWMWSLVGGVVTVNSLQFSHRNSVVYSLFNLALFGTIALVILYGLCLGFLLIGGWLPLVPSALALLITGGSVMFYTFLQQQRNY